MDCYARKLLHTKQLDSAGQPFAGIGNLRRDLIESLGLGEQSLDLRNNE
ncbi:hypothetical protein [Rhodococcus qingshengii]|nr:hypothetical protein [Rhodococcus qingshengii]